MNAPPPVILALLALLVGWLPVQTAAPAPADRAGQPVFKAESQLVVLNVSVRDGSGRHVGGLAREAFTIVDDGQPQVIAMFSAEDVPASVGLVIDNSNSMAPSRERVIAAAVAFARNSHPQDEVFALTFNEHVREAWAPAIIGNSRPQQFEAALTGAITARGMTALYDGLAEALRRVALGAHTRQVLIVVSDGSDNASRMRQDDIVRDARASDAVIYTVGITDNLTRDGNPRLLGRLARETGGESFRPRVAAEVPNAFARIASDIRSTYTLAYSPTVGRGAPAPDRRRAVNVYVRSPNGRPLRVRTRDSYPAAPGGHQ